jgi:hypothetical protein
LEGVDAQLQVFAGEAHRQFRFLIDRHGFAALASADACHIGYGSPPWSVWIILNLRNRTVDTFIWYDDGTVCLYVPLKGLLNTKGLPTQLAVNSAQSPRSLTRSVGLQAKALARVLPDLMASGGRHTMLDAGAACPAEPRL